MWAVVIYDTDACESEVYAYKEQEAARSGMRRQWDMMLNEWTASGYYIDECWCKDDTAMMMSGYWRVEFEVVEIRDGETEGVY